jgi:hypothetical protein
VTLGGESTATLIFLAIALEVIMVAASFQAKAQGRGCSLLLRKQIIRRQAGKVHETVQPAAAGQSD